MKGLYKIKKNFNKLVAKYLKDLVCIVIFRIFLNLRLFNELIPDR